jgi:hypothetical protein
MRRDTMDGMNKRPLLRAVSMYGCMLCMICMLPTIVQGLLTSISASQHLSLCLSVATDHEPEPQSLKLEVELELKFDAKSSLSRAEGLRFWPTLRIFQGSARL